MNYVHIIAFLGLGFLTCMSPALTGFTYVVPGGISPSSYLSLIVGAFSLGVCGYGYRKADMGERVARLICAGAAVWVFGPFLTFYYGYTHRVYHAYHG
jgi:hypothetical protein